MEEDPNGGKARVGCEYRGYLGVRFDKLNELRGEAGEVLEPVERPGAGCEVWGDLGVRFDRLNELKGREVLEPAVPELV